MSDFRYALRSFFRAGPRNLTYLTGLALAVALFSGTLFFVNGSARSMTQRAVAPVVLDLQARAVDPNGEITGLAPTLAARPGVEAVLPFTASAIHIAPPATGGGAADTAARLFAMPPTYPDIFPLLTVSSGRFEPGHALVSEQLAASRNLKPGDTLNLLIPGRAAPYPVTLSGTVNLDRAEPLFAGPSTAEGTYSATDSVIVIDDATFNRDLRATLQAATLAAQQSASANAPGALLGPPLLDRQLHIRVARASLPADPTQAQTAVTALSHGLEQQASGQIKITNNLSAALTSASKDIVSARLLFIFLGLPGVLLAAYLSRYAAQLVTDAQRREVALLRSRGIGPKQVLTIMGWMALLVALLGTAIGLGIGALGMAVLFGASFLRDGSGLLVATLASLALGLILGGVGVFLPARRMLEGEINEERRVIAATRRPLWLRLPIDGALLALGALALWFSGTYTSKAATAGATETAAVSLGIYTFLGPLLCWLGMALLVRRIADWLLTRPSRGWRGGFYGLAARSLRRRVAQSAGAVVLLALALSFGVATTVFGASFDASRRADAQYLVGSDVRVTPALTAPQPVGFADQLRVPGVRAVSAVAVANNTLVGAQTQTVYGVDVPSLTAATTIQDRFFVGSSAKQALDALAATPNGLLISNELGIAYNVQMGDTVTMRIPKPSGAYADATLRVVGIFTIFPTSTQNSDLVVNRAFLQSATTDPNAAFFLVKGDGTNATTDAIATTLTQQLKNRLPVRIESATRAVSADQSSLVGLNLAGLLAIDRLFTILIVAVAVGVFLLGSILERQRELGTLEALGATPGQVMRLLLIEGGVIVAGGIVGGLTIGLVLAWQYNHFLPSIFAVPLPMLRVPVAALGLLIGLSAAGVVLAALGATLRLRRLWPAEALRGS
ncbi:MAG: FtsX-like permease family protein [Thermomicrobiales bacterium]